METLSLEQVKAYQGEYKVVPICRSIYADVRTPIEVLRIVKNISSHCYLLESMEDSQRWGRYTFIGYDPQMGLYCKDSTVHIKTGAEVQIHTDHPEQLISQTWQIIRRRAFRTCLPLRAAWSATLPMISSNTPNRR